MPVKEYYVPAMPEEEEHSGFRGLIDKLEGIFGVHQVTVDRGAKQITVHMHDEGALSNVDAAINEFGQLPGYTGQV